MFVKCLEKCLVSAMQFLSQGKYEMLQRILWHMDSDFLAVLPSSAFILLMLAKLCFCSVFLFSSAEQVGRGTVMATV